MPKLRGPVPVAEKIRRHIQENIRQYRSCPPEEVSYRVRKALAGINSSITKANIRQVIHRLRLSGVLQDLPSDFSVTKVIDSLRQVRAEFGEEYLRDTVRGIVRELQGIGVMGGDITTEVICTALPRGITLDKDKVREVLSDLRDKGELSPLSPEAIDAIVKKRVRGAWETKQERALGVPGSYGYKATRISVFIEKLLDLGADPDIFTIMNVFSKLRGEVKGITQNDVLYVLRRLRARGVLPELSPKKEPYVPMGPRQRLITAHIMANLEHYQEMPPERLVFEIGTALAKDNKTVGRLDVAYVVRRLRRRGGLPKLQPENYGEYLRYWASLGQRALAARQEKTEKVWRQVSRKDK